MVQNYHRPQALARTFTLECNWCVEHIHIHTHTHTNTHTNTYICAHEFIGKLIIAAAEIQQLCARVAQRACNYLKGINYRIVFVIFSRLWYDDAKAHEIKGVFMCTIIIIFLYVPQGTKAAKLVLKHCVYGRVCKNCSVLDRSSSVMCRRAKIECAFHYFVRFFILSWRT